MKKLLLGSTYAPYFEGKILVVELSGLESTEAQNQFLNSLSSFQSQNRFETVLLVYPHWKISFEDFYEFTKDCEEHLVTLNLEDEFQLVAFHPNFCFGGLSFEDRANLVNSSPFPLIHILRIHDLELINLSAKDAEAMSFGNAKKLESLSSEHIRLHFPWR